MSQTKSEQASRSIQRDEMKLYAEKDNTGIQREREGETIRGKNENNREGEEDDLRGKSQLFETQADSQFFQHY